MATQKLDKKEIAILQAVERLLKESGHEWRVYDLASHEALGACWLTGQRAALYEPRLMYHEGYFRRGDELLHHAWNTLNGKIADLQWNIPFEDMHYHADRYKAEKSYTPDEVRNAMLARGARWDWMEPDLKPAKKSGRAKK